MSVNLGTISFELTEASIQQAIYDLAGVYEKIYDAIGKLIEKCTAAKPAAEETTPED